MAAKKKNIGKFGDEPFYPIVGFYFEVSFDGISRKSDSKFSEVSGITMERELGTAVKEGGRNNFTYQLPARSKYSDLELKRGMLSPDSDLNTWCTEVIQSDLSKKIKVRDVFVKLMNEKGDAIMTWHFYRTFPKKMSVTGLNSTATGKSAIVVESMTLVYEYFEIVKQ